MTAQAQERLAGAVVLGLPLLVTFFGINYEHRLNDRAGHVKISHGKLHVYHITGIAKPGMWTLDPVIGHNYWRHPPTRLREIKVRRGDTLVLVLTSADVEHGFIIPALGIGPYTIEPGHRKVIHFTADRAGSFPFLCAKICSCTGHGFACTLHKKEGHEGMTGVLTVEEPLGPPNDVVNVTISEDKGFQPATIKVKQGDVVQVKVTSQSNGTGQGVGFCIQEYETRVDLQGIASGDSRTFKFRADKPGNFLVYSSTKAGPKIDTAMASFVVNPKPH